MPDLRALTGTLIVVPASKRRRRKFVALPSVDASMEGGLGLSAPSHVVDDELHEVFVTVADHDVFHSAGWRFSGPDGLPCWAVAFQACA